MFTLVSVVLAVFPARSVQVPDTDWPRPSPRVVGPETELTPERLSVQEKLTVTGPSFQPLVFGGTDLELDTPGGVRSMLMLPTVADAELPARSMHVPVTDCGPSVSRVVGVERVSTPDSASVHVKDTVTVELFHPNEFAPGVLEPVIDGRVRSMLMSLSLVLAGLPARSTHVPLTVWLKPSPRVAGGDMLNTPDRESVQAKLTVTGVLFQPLLFGWTDLELEMFGSVRSMLMLFSVVEAELPAISKQVPVTD